MRCHQVLSAFGIVLCGSLVAAQGIQSGPKAGSNIPGPFHPVVVLHAERPDGAGKRWDFTEQYGAHPYVLIFVRTVSEPLAGLLAKVDAEMAKHRDVKDKKDAWSAKVYGAVMLCDQNASDEPLKKLAKRLKIKHISLALDNSAGPRHYRLDKEADITVLLISRRKVEANYAFRKGELRDMHVEQIVGDLQKTLLLFSLAVPAGQKQAADDAAEIRGRLRLNAIEISVLLERYQALFKRELSLQDSVRAATRSGDTRLPEYQQALEDAQNDLEKTKKRLIALESEKAKFIERLGKKDVGDASLEPMERANRTLEKILDRLSSIDKRLEKIERQK